jgi:hypothetical protein
MPQSVPLANAEDRVLPRVLCKAFSRSRNYPTEVNQFANGESIRGADATNSRRSWTLVPHLDIAAMLALRTFYEDTGAKAFHFYEMVAPYTWDETGNDETNRFTVVFRGKWIQTQSIRRGEVNLSLEEVAGVLPGSGQLDFSNPNASAHS